VSAARQIVTHRVVRTVVVLDGAADVDAPSGDFLNAFLDPAGNHRAQARQPTRLAQAREKHLVFKTTVVFAHDLDLQILARPEMREHTAFAHLHALGQEPNRQTFQSVAACQIECCIENRDARLFAFSHSCFLPF
jgi:hypothetical protein